MGLRYPSSVWFRIVVAAAIAAPAIPLILPAGVFLLEGFFVQLIVVVLWTRLAMMIAAAVCDRLCRPFGPGRGRPRVTAIVPAYNEEVVIQGAIRALAGSDWADLEIIAVDDGSVDATFDRARALLPQIPNLRVIAQRPNQGKAAALNRGVAEATGEIIVVLDADSVLEPDAIRRLAAAFDDPEVAAVAANVKVGNRNGLLGVFQSIEYISSLNIERRAQCWLGWVTTVPGAGGAWRRSAVIAQGGFPPSVAEDTDLTVRLLRANRKVLFEDRAIVRTEAPETPIGLFRQRQHWCHGSLDSAVIHRGGLFRGAWYGRLVGMPNFLYLNAISPIFAIVLIPVFFVVTPQPLALVVIGAIDGLAATFAYLMDRERKRELLVYPLWRLVYPIFLSITLSILLYRLARGQKEWVRVKRTGSILSST